VDFDEVAGRLYAGDPDAFVTDRTAAVAQARAAGDRPLATRLGALKKPTRSAWLVNLLAAGDSSSLSELSELAERVARAHRNPDLAALREVGAQRQKLVDDLTRRALTTGADRGYVATEAVRLEVHGTLASAVADPDVREQVLAGRVIKAQVYSGFGLTLGGIATTAASVQPEPPMPEPGGPSDDKQERDHARQIAQQAVAAATDRVVEARTALKASEAAEHEAAQGLDLASREVADLRHELRTAELAEKRARRGATEAADELHDARVAVQQAEQALADAARALGDSG